MPSEVQNISISVTAPTRSLEVGVQGLNITSVFKAVP